MSASPARYFPGILPKRNGAAAVFSIPVGGVAPEHSAAEVLDECSDEALLLRLQERDVQALGLLYRRYARLVYSVCARILRDSAEAEDLVHEVFLCLYRRCKSFDPAKGAARSWIIQLTYSKCFDWCDYLRTRHGYGQGSGVLDEASVVSRELGRHEDPATLIVWNARMKEAFKSLSKEQQLTLTLYYFQGYTFQEVAEKLGYSYGNVKHHVYRGIKQLRRIVFDGAAHGLSGTTDCVLRCEAGEATR